MNSSLAKAKKDQWRTEEIFDFCEQSEAILALCGGSNLSVFVGQTILVLARQQQRTEGSFDFCKQSEATLALSGGSNLSVFVGRTILVWTRQYQLPTLPIIFLACSSTDDRKRLLCSREKEYSFIGIRFYIRGRLASEYMAREFS